MVSGGIFERITRSVGREESRLFADRQGRRTARRGARRCASGATIRATASCRSCSPIAATASRCGGFASRRTTGENWKPGDLMWIDHARRGLRQSMRPSRTVAQEDLLVVPARRRRPRRSRRGQAQRLGGIAERRQFLGPSSSFDADLLQVGDDRLLQAPLGFTVSSAISRSATTGFLSRSRSMVRSAPPET